MKIVRRNKYDLSRVLRENESIGVEIIENEIVVDVENKDEVNDIIAILNLTFSRVVL